MLRRPCLPDRSGGTHIKFGICLLDTPDAWTTLWHSAALRRTVGMWTLMPRARVEQLGRLVHHEGRPSLSEQD
ncbi:hypothetical protein ACFZBP_02955 [Streptomyces sp. NPDC008086]|uniref:hypothetical protein n=1 Tax=Streptomyces sp. NPDC008086 TaxID=3364807 RepID=UPI0036E7711A